MTNGPAAMVTGFAASGNARGRSHAVLAVARDQTGGLVQFFSHTGTADSGSGRAAR
jgi:hypothetical protein